MSLGDLYKYSGKFLFFLLCCLWDNVYKSSTRLLCSKYNFFKCQSFIFKKMKVNFSFWVLGDKIHTHQIQDFINEGMHAQLHVHVRLFESLLIVACQVPLIPFSRSGLPFPTPRDHPDPGNRSCVSLHSCIGRRILYFWATWDTINEDTAAAKSLHHVWLSATP